MIGAILTGVFSKFAGSTLAGTLSNRLYAPYAPSGTLFPCGIVAVDTEHDFQFIEEIEEPDVTFTLFSRSTGNTEITTMISQLISLYDETTLTIAGYSHAYMHRERIIGPIGDAETDVRQATVIYNLMLIKS